MERSLIIRTSLLQGVFVLSLNRPEKRNALSIELLRELLNALREVPATARVLILQGEGDFFCAGLDLNEAKEKSLQEEMSALMAEVLKTLLELPLATLAYVHGGAYAGGMGLVAASDLAIASRESLFSLPELRRGLVPAFVYFLLEGQVSSRFLNELILIGEPITAIHAHAMGLLNRVIGKEEKESTLRDLSAHLLKNAPLALGTYKRDLMHKGSFQTPFSKALELHRKVREGGEAEEGVRAFFEKRPPSWIL